MENKFSSDQKHILISCIAVYTAAYICRLNLSAALTGIMEAEGISVSAAGMLQTAFAMIYATGQFVNGSIVDRVNPMRHMLIGLAGAAACNLLMGLSASYPMMLAAWAGNAVFQSMMWTPIMRLVTLHFTQQRKRELANEMLALTLIAGHFLAWAISGFLSGMFSWRFSFVIPAAIALAVSIAVRAYMRGVEAAGRAQAAHARRQRGQTQKAIPMLAQSGFLLVLAACVLYGFIRDGVITWTPTILAAIGRESAMSATTFTLILPVINAGGVLLGFELRRRGAKARYVVVAMMAVSLCCCTVLMPVGGMLMTAVLLGGICAAMYGANTMLTALIPQEYDRVGKTGLTAGLVDSFIYMGSALAGVLAGGVYENMGTIALYIVWGGASIVSMLIMARSGKMGEAYWKRQEKA